ncbi:MAG: hypothetical protein J7507_14570 [Pseudoxanthomonas sp.]|nr:hypothetical protein [Pseudoxanthomonas sp.]
MLAVGLFPAAVRCQGWDTGDTVTASDAQISFLAIGNLPLDGGFVPGGVRSRILFDEGRKSEWENDLRAAWGIDAFPATVEGATWKGEPVRVRLEGVEPNEFGKLWIVAQPPAGDAGPLIYWSGKRAPKVRPPATRVLDARDEVVIRAECTRVGHEMKQPAMTVQDIEGNSRPNWYLDPVFKEEKADIADPDVAANVRIDAVSPTGNPGVGLAGCWFASMSTSGMRYRGPVFAYDFHAHRIVWSDALDLDEHVNFLEYEGSIYLVEFFYCDVCETDGWSVGLFAERTPSGNERRASSESAFRIVGRDASSVGGTASWFDDE